MMRDILVLCPQERDLNAIAAAGVENRFRVHCVGSDLDQLESFDPVALLEECDRIPADGVIGTKDLSGLLAALVAERRGLPGPSPQALIACQHKPMSRAVQSRVAPEATPAFAPLDEFLPFELPFFAKPVVGRLSQNAIKILEPADLLSLEEIHEYTSRWTEIAGLAGFGPRLAHGFLAEELLEGEEVTLEGYVHGGEVTTIGVTDSVKYPGTNSFERFEYPSVLPRERQAELSAVSSTIVSALGFDDGFFNVEFFVADGRPPQIIEVNGRIASQFAPLVQALHGRSTYEALFELACGEDPGWEVGIPEGFGISYCLRSFDDAYVESVPDPEDGLELLVRPGLRLSEQGVNDAQSYRLAILYTVGKTREDALRRCRERADALKFRLAPAPVR